MDGILSDLDEMRSERKLWENAALADIRTANKRIKNEFSGNSSIHIPLNKKCLSSTEKVILKNIQNDTFKAQENKKKEQTKKNNIKLTRRQQIAAKNKRKRERLATREGKAKKCP